jgi:cyanophycinase
MATKSTRSRGRTTQRGRSRPKPRERRGAAPSGTLIVIGGHEDKNGDRFILKTVCEPAVSQKCRLVVATVASGQADVLWKDYERLFRDAGSHDVRHLHIQDRKDAFNPTSLRTLDGAGVVFFTGGDQLRITSKLGGTPVLDRIREIYEAGGTLAGTSAGASAMSETMVVGGQDDQSPRVRDSLQMAPGLGFMTGVIIDQHFAERGRLGRLVGAVAQNPRVLGIGIDEDSAVVARAGKFQVIGSGAVYVVDGVAESYTNLSEESKDARLSVFDIRLHIMSKGDSFDMESRRPARAPSDQDPGPES